MKKGISFVVMLALCAGMLCACSVSYPASESDSYFENTIELLSAGDIKAAEDLNCVIAGNVMETQLQTASEYLAGRKVTEYKKTSSEITNRNSTAGPETREAAIYEVTLDDGAVLIFHTFYSDGHCVKGFTSFELQSD